MASTVSGDLRTWIDRDLRDPDAVYILRDEYDRLVQISRQYANLRENLISGGINDETIDLLSNNPPGHVDNNTPATAPATPHPPSVMGVSSDTHEVDSDAPASPCSTATSNRARGQWTDAGKENDDGPHLRIFPPDTNARVIPQQAHLGRDAPRTLLLSNLAEGTSHADITSAVRGGQLLEVFMRPRAKYASVSFVHAQDAGAFYEYVRRHGLYISQKRVEVSWNNRQVHLPDHFAQKVKFGASRNLVIRRCDPQLNEDEIRQDLEHIHKLVVIRAEFISGNCHVSTNSVFCASFARTCMMSRRKFKGSRIEYDVDECAQTLDRMPKHTRGLSTNATVLKTLPGANTMPNRFQLLGLDDE